MAFISNGTTILDAGAFDVSLGSQVLISEQTASGSASIEFTTGIDSTYPIYRFEFINIHPVNSDVLFQFNLSTDSGSNYNVTKTTTLFFAGHDEADTATSLLYYANQDLAQSTAFQNISLHPGEDNDQSCSGEMWLYNPSSTTFVKHFMSRISANTYLDYAYDTYCAGYGNTTSSINAIKFQMESGNIDSATIKLYGIKDS